MLTKPLLVWSIIANAAVGLSASLVTQWTTAAWDGWSLAVGAAVAAILGTLLSAPLMYKLGQMTTALQWLDREQPTPPINPLPLGLLGPLVTEINRVIENQQAFQNAQGRLYQQISEVAAQEERKRLARDLHDSIKQQVFSINISAAAAEAHLNSDPTAARDALVMVKRSAQEAMVEMRALLQQLAPAPLEKFGLVEALREQAEALGYRTGAQVETTFGDLPSDDLLPVGTQEALFRITQEALSNIARHARARHVWLKLAPSDTDTLRLQICDDGQGFDPAATLRGMGLGNIERRVADINGAALDLTSEPGRGTSVSIHIPLTDKQSEQEEIIMQEKVKSAAEQVVSNLTGAGIALSFTLLGGLLAVIESQQEALFWVMAGSVMAAVVGTVFGVRYGRQWLASRRAFLALPGAHDSPARYHIRQRWYQMVIVLGFVLMLMGPSAMIELELPPWWSTGVGIMIFGGMLLSIVGSVWTQHRYFAELDATERQNKMRSMRSEIVWTWIALAFMTLAILLPSTTTGFYFPAMTGDEWDSNFFASMIVLYTLYCLSWSGVYAYWERQAPQQAGDPA